MGGVLIPGVREGVCCALAFFAADLGEAVEVGSNERLLGLDHLGEIVHALGALGQDEVLFGAGDPDDGDLDLLGELPALGRDVDQLVQLVVDPSHAAVLPRGERGAGNQNCPATRLGAAASAEAPRGGREPGWARLDSALLRGTAYERRSLGTSQSRDDRVSRSIGLRRRERAIVQSSSESPGDGAAPASGGRGTGKLPGARWLGAGLRWWCVVLLYGAIASNTVHVVFFHQGGPASHRLIQAIEGASEAPFSYRWLISAVAQGLTRLTPGPFERWLTERPYGPSGESRVDRMAEVFGWDPQGRAVEGHRGPRYPLQHVYAYGLSVASCFFAMGLLRWMGRRWLSSGAPSSSLGGIRGVLADGGPGVLGFFLPVLFLEGSYFYDFPELLLAVAALAMVWTRRWGGFALVMGLAVLNKETSALWCLWPAAVVGLRPRALAVSVAPSGVVAVTAGLFVRWAIQDGGPPTYELHLGENLGFLASRRAWLGFFDFFAAGIPFPRPTHLLLVVPVVHLAVLGYRRRRPQVFGAVFLLTAVPILTAWLFIGYRDELRVFLPTVPSLYFLVLAGVVADREGESGLQDRETVRTRGGSRGR